MTGTLILLRHGNSEWNESGRFTGWVDVRLAASGVAQARRAGLLLAGSGLLPDRVYTSVLSRAIRTADVTLDEICRHWVPANRSWRLNERHYGVLQGRRKSDVVAEFGAEKFLHWRRSYHGAPPPLPDDSPHSTVADPRYAALGDTVPRTESLAQVGERLLPYWSEAIAPDVSAGATVLVVSHSNALRALVKHLDGMSDPDIETINVPTGIPLVYTFDRYGRIDSPGRYLDPAAASAGAAAVASEGFGNGVG